MPSYPIVGARFRPPAQEVLDNLPAGTKLLLRRQPDNPYDGNAVQVILPGFPFAEVPDDINTILSTAGIEDINADLHLGFIPRESAAKIAPLMDERGSVNEEGNAEWPGILTFNASGAPMVSFEMEKS